MGDDGGTGFSPALRAVTELSSDSIFLVDAEHRITYINRTAEGLAVEDVIGTVIFDLLAEDQAAIARAAFERVERTGEQTSYEVTFPLPDGRLSRWTTQIGPQPDGSFVVVSSDVTEHASARDELDLLFALSRDLLIVVGYDGEYQRMSPATFDTLGYSFEELRQRSFLDLVHPDDRERASQSFRQVVEHGAEVTLFESRHRTRGGDYRILQWTARPDPPSRRVVAIARDVTESRAMERQLRQSQKMDAVGQLAGGIAHDFNNLLQAIFGAVDVAKRVSTEPEVAEQLQDVEMAAAHAADLVRQLLSFSRQQPYSSTRVVVGELVEGPVKLLRRVLPATIGVRVVEGPGSHAVIADRAQIEQALLNLCLNARDAMPEGGTLAVEVDELTLGEDTPPPFYGAKPGHYVVLSVTDEGVGMTPEVRERLFEPFFTTKPTGQGTGLGMSMVYGAVTAHGGSVHVESQPGSGTCVRLLLPVAASAAPPAQVRAQPPKQAAGGDERILLAEDDALVRRLCVRMLEGAGYRVLAAADGAEAVALARAHDDIDLALFDVVMPELTGPQAYARVRELHPDLPVIFSTGYADVSKLSHAVPKGATTLAKPLRMEELLAVVRDLLDGRRAAS